MSLQYYNVTSRTCVHSVYFEILNISNTYIENTLTHSLAKHFQKLPTHAREGGRAHVRQMESAVDARTHAVTLKLNWLIFDKHTHNNSYPSPNVFVSTETHLQIITVAGILFDEFQRNSIVMLSYCCWPFRSDGIWRICSMHTELHIRTRISFLRLANIYIPESDRVSIWIFPHRPTSNK